ncbi:Mitochondrial import inner membrane translocase subunit TIM23-1 [Acorus gramineus]|uniref:Mitochondrial import inner membrane translocase subunit TIM23-1 n=1 Tax=Acorus gramineus TaxID=55184 RepID=A0AAV9A136_ACOGR|nr:Mitochondrial import inner membrane translocase subunit TIM23-1 [Acorus gramineus]
MRRPKGGTKEEEGFRLYNPYKTLHENLPNHYLFKLPTSPELLFPEVSLKHRHAFDENIFFYTGAGYVFGALSGGVKGFVDSVRSFERGDTTKLRVTRLLSESGSAGRRVGICLVMIALCRL